MNRRFATLMAWAIISLGGCAHHGAIPGDPVHGPRGDFLSDIQGAVRAISQPIAGRHGGDMVVVDARVEPPTTHEASHVSYGEPAFLPAGLSGPQRVADTDGPYLLDTGDQLRIFVYGQPNLSRIYVVDHGGMISVPLIGNVKARGMTTYGVSSVIRDLLGRDFVRDPQVTVDVQQARPFFILGEVRNAGQYPYVSGMTVETAVAIAGGYTERANLRRFKITRRINGLVEVIEAPSDYVVQAGDTVTVFERFF
ncbi:MAG: polysaccharide biosynthesis/export family protein [Pseudomonadota bacterium]